MMPDRRLDVSTPHGRDFSIEVGVLFSLGIGRGALDPTARPEAKPNFEI
jgi:hypothetical protein